MFTHHIVKAGSFIDAKQTADSSCDAANHPRTAPPTGPPATFGGAAFRTAGNTLTLGGEWRSEQSRDNSYSESLLHLHHFSFLSKASQTTSPPVSSIAGQAGNSLPRGLNHSSNGVTMLAKFAER
ncbi:MAG: hypothetical protein USCAAHI_00719 [Beijerinckiaceae bacterium]|nr:MAG: hypothetical protein USCAAHI_00719 [Beijerinckiaceae bacterium]